MKNGRDMGGLASGLELLFLGNCLELAAAVLTLLGVLDGLASLMNLAGFVVGMIALNRLRDSHPGYGRAFIFELVGMALALVAVGLMFAALTMAFNAGTVEFTIPLVGAALTAAAVSVLEWLAVRSVCLATASLAEAAGEEAAAALSRTVSRIYLACIGVSVVCVLLEVLPGLGGVGIVLIKLAALASAARQGLMVYFLHRARSCLA